MSQRVLLSIQGRQEYAGQQPELIELVTEGTMTQLPEGWEVSYEESALTGMEGTTTTFRMEPGQVTLLREGKLQSTMVFREGESYDSLYQMELGTLMMTVRATQVSYELGAQGGVIQLAYKLDIENSDAGTIRYRLDIQAK